jgi:type IV pilus assembly protein PilC
MRNKRLSYEELAGLSRQLSLIIDSDLSIQEGISLMTDQTAGKDIKLLLERVGDSIKKGRTLGRALSEESKMIPEYYSEMVLIGEESGNLQAVLTNMAESYEKDVKTAKKVRSAVTYPVVLSVLMLGVIVLLITTVMPMFRDILDSLGGSIPGFSKAMIDAASFLGRNILAILGLLIVLLIALDIYKNTKSGKKHIDKLKLKIPVQKEITRDLAALRFARNMGMLIRSGIPTAKAMLMIKPVLGNETISKRIDIAAGLVNKGVSMKEALDVISLFPPLLSKLLSVAEATGHMEEIFNRSADIMSEELDNRLDRLTTILEPFLIIILSLILGAILLSVVFPVIDIMNSIG